MHKYRNKKLPVSFVGIFKDASDTQGTQNRHNDYNYDTLPAAKRYLENVPLKQTISNWNSLNLELKATADPLNFETMLKHLFYQCISMNLPASTIVLYGIQIEFIFLVTCHTNKQIKYFAKR